jgi:hypothetical protein
MAVKTWSAGEVLAAADLNDTIADAKNAPAPFNLLYNGAMQVAQRGTSTASITTNGYYTADRWQISSAGAQNGSWTMSVETDAPTGSGLRKSLRMLLPTADAPSASESVQIAQPLEGQDLQRIAKGTSSAQQLTLSFWVKSNKIGTYVAELYDNDNNRSVSMTYSISASATWEKKTITFSGDTSGAFDNDNAASLFLIFWLSAGSDYTSGTLATSWGTLTTANRAVGQTDVAANNNNYWQITGVQLEVGPTATPFEFKSYGTELAECQRYYQRITTTASISFAQGWANGTTVCDLQLLFSQMRVAPTSIDVSNYQVYRPANATTYSGGTVTLTSVSSSAAQIRYTHTSGVFTSAENLIPTLASGYLGISAEL